MKPKVDATDSFCCAHFEHFITFFPHKLGRICGKRITTAELIEKLVHVTERGRLEFIFKHCSCTGHIEAYVHAHTHTGMYLYHTFNYLTDFVKDWFY